MSKQHEPASHSSEATQSSSGKQPACRDDASTREIDDNLSVVHDGFNWLGVACHDQLETLRRELHEKTDETWSDRLIEGVLSLALAAGTAGIASFIAAELVKAGEVAKEVVDKILEHGLEEGTHIAIKAMHESPEKRIDAFIDAQQSAVMFLTMDRQQEFTRVGRHQIDSVAESEKLASTFAKACISTAASKQHDASRDAWVTALARETFGELHQSETPTTYIGNQARRDHTNKPAPHFVPDRAPSFDRAVFGEVPGFLEVWAELPDIENNQMLGTPYVRFAFLNGVSKTIRQQYEGAPLKDLRIPRQIAAKVKGKFPDFTANIDEKGSIHTWHERIDWLRARAVMENPANAEQGQITQAEVGVDLLLQELVTRGIA